MVELKEIRKNKNNFNKAECFEKSDPWIPVISELINP